MATSEDHLVKQCLEGNDAAWSTIVHSYARSILGMSRRFAGRPDQAEELAQDIFLRVYQSLHKYRLGEDSFRPWLWRIARNLLIDHCRKTRRHRESSIDSVDGWNFRDERSPDPLRSVLQNEAVENFRRSLSRLPAICQEAMMLRSFYGLQYQEVAAILDITEGTVKSRIHRGRRELARLLAQQRAS